MERTKKHLKNVFKENGLDVVLDCEMKIVNYLNVAFSINDCTHGPYQKPDEII